MRTEGNGGERSAAGLTAGVAGFLAVLAAPLAAEASTVVRLGLGWTALIAALGLLGLTRAPLARVGGAVAACFGVALLLNPFLLSMPAPARSTLAATVLMAAWWISEAIPIPATSLAPLVLFPILGVLPSGAVAGSYANNNIFLFMGGFILALGIQRWGLHRRIALRIVYLVGTDLSRMVLGFMLAAAFLSMWISNTATTLMMLPIALAVISSLREIEGGRQLAGLAPALLLGTAYAASIGGLATPIGTPPNISFLRILQILYPEAPSISFGRWLTAFLPLVAIFLPIAWLMLTRVVHRLGGMEIAAGREVVREQLRKLGPMGRAERRMLLIFAATAVLWITRGDLDLGVVRLPGWSGLLDRLPGEFFASGNLHDATVAMAMAILTFVVPGEPDEQGRLRALMDWETARRLPWGILLLFGGGFALAGAYVESGLSRYIGQTFAEGVGGWSPLLLVLATCLMMTFLTEVTSNTAVTEIMLPVLGGTAAAMSVHPLLLMLPATLSASCAFMLPIATPPNAIVFGSGEISMRQMVRAGVLLNLLGALLLSLFFYFGAARVLGLELGSLPLWATG